MTDQPHDPTIQPHSMDAGYPQPPQPPVMYAPAQPPMPYGPPVGKVRSTGLCILLAIVTFGIYPIVWYFMVHDEMKRHSNEGIGGGIALLLALVIGIVMPYLTSSEVGRL
ncbi:MAG TPA: DUF4234 domain-containing protein, partial [Gaiellales bacterium]|nr:DUF4234 domain-containing protein [Gaiellales bacterium]